MNSEIKKSLISRRKAVSFQEDITMATITINSQILSGNLGEWETDLNKVADALAEFTEKQWRLDLSEYMQSKNISEDDFNITIDVEYNTSGASREVSVYSDDFDVMSEVENLLTDEGSIWEKFCDTYNG